MNAVALKRSRRRDGTKGKANQLDLWLLSDSPGKNDCKKLWAEYADAAS